MTARIMHDNADEVTAEIMACADPDRALAESFDALILAFGEDAVRCMAAEKLGEC